MQKSPAVLDLCSSKTKLGKSHDYCDIFVLKNSVVKMFPSTLKRKVSISDSSTLKSCFKKFLAEWSACQTRNLVFSVFSGIVWTGPMTAGWSRWDTKAKQLVIILSSRKKTVSFTEASLYWVCKLWYHLVFKDCTLILSRDIWKFSRRL